MRTLLSLSLCFFLASALARAESTDWKTYARRLTGESAAVTASALRHLKAIENIENELRAALGTDDRYLALETIADMRLEALVPDLLDLSGCDEDGAVFLTLNALLGPSNQNKIASHYARLLSPGERGRLSVPVKVILLDTLARMGIELPPRELSALLKSRAHDVRIAALYYARHFLVRGNPMYLDFVRFALGQSPLQLRLRARNLVKDLPPVLQAVASTFPRLDEKEREPAAEAEDSSLPDASGSCSAASEAIPGLDAFLVRDLASKSEPSRPALRCRKAYERFYARPTVEIRVVFGYKDARPARYVGDRYEALSLKHRLVSDGFEPDADDSELLWREVRGPDGAPRVVQVRIVSSSVGPDDDENRHDTFQKWQSVHAKAMFLDGLGRADAVFYDGHSRDGGGPDFEPPHLTADHHVDYDWYAKEKPGMEALLEELEEDTSPTLLGFFSCISDRFVPEVREKSPRMATISSPRLMFYADALEHLHGAISSLVGLKCRSGFEAAVGATPAGGYAHLRGFF